MGRSLYKIGILLFSISLLCVAVPSYADDPPLPTPVGRVVWIKGTLKATMPNKEQRLLQKTSVIYLNDTLTTDATSQAQIVFTDNTLMTFRPSTSFYIDQYQYDAKSTKKGSVGKYVMKLIEGGFRTITGLIAKKNPNDYQVNTPVATIGVRGTDYAVVLRGGQISMAFYAGSPCMNTKKGQLCLSSAVPYGMVPGIGTGPVPLQTQPADFKEKQLIVPATIQPFVRTGNAVSTTARDRGPVTQRGGTVSSFCIQ